MGSKIFSIIIFLMFIILFLFVSIPSFFIYKILLNAKEDLSIQEVVKFQLKRPLGCNHRSLKS